MKPAYRYLFVVLGAGIGLFSAMATLTQQLLCPLGYSDVKNLIKYMKMVYKLRFFLGSRRLCQRIHGSNGLCGFSRHRYSSGQDQKIHRNY